MEAINIIYKHTLSTDTLIPYQPLFDSLEEVKKNLQYAYLSQALKNQYSHFLGIQERNDVIQSMVRVLKGQASIHDAKIDGLKS